MGSHELNSIHTEVEGRNLKPHHHITDTQTLPKKNHNSKTTYETSHPSHKQPHKVKILNKGHHIALSVISWNLILQHPPSKTKNFILQQMINSFYRISLSQVNFSKPKLFDIVLQNKVIEKNTTL